MPSGARLLSSPRPALLVHGGAWGIPYDQTADHLDGLRRAASRGAELLGRGATAVETVVEVVALLEEDPAFNAGRGAVLNRAGEVELDAGLMCGATAAFGAVAGVRRIARPIRAAHALLRQNGEARLLIADGAEAFARTQGLETASNDAFVVDRERRLFERLRGDVRFHTSQPFVPEPESAPGDTVGCVARDAEGRLAAGTSTGGTAFAPPGRVGDSPLPGCGFYADVHAAVSATGWGEAISAVVLAARVADRVAHGESPERAAARLLAHMHERVRNPRGRGARGGLIVIDAAGQAGWAYTTPRMARAGWQAGEGVWTAL